MKKITLLFLVSVIIFGMTACKKEVKETKTTSSSVLSMEQVEGKEDISSESEYVLETSESVENSQKKQDVKQLLNDFGDGYANYDSINDRNNKLKKVMTDECIQMNGIASDSAVMLASRGEVITIYQPIDGEKDQYAILLNCEQNGSKLRILLLVKVTGDKVSEMTYNTVKQEY